jgi:hypothetical protein
MNVIFPFSSSSFSGQPVLLLGHIILSSSQLVYMPMTTFQILMSHSFDSGGQTTSNDSNTSYRQQ